MTATYAALRQALATAEWAGLPVPSVDFQWHGADEETATHVVSAFSDRRWRAAAGGQSEWLESFAPDGGHLIVYLPQIVPRPAADARAKAILAAVEASA